LYRFNKRLSVQESELVQILHCARPFAIHQEKELRLDILKILLFKELNLFYKSWVNFLLESASLTKKFVICL
jgi:hypothetical protein